MENYLYFADPDVEGSAEGYSADNWAITVPAKNFLNAQPYSDTLTLFFFRSIQGYDEGNTGVFITHASGKNKEIINAFMACISSESSDGFIVVADSDVAGSSKNAEYSKVFNGLGISGISVMNSAYDGSWQRNTVEGTHVGAGAKGTYSEGGAPITIKRRVEAGVIITQLWIDITGLGGKGDAADDVIGLAAGGAAYIYRNIVADNGIIFKYEISCIELPAAASGAATADIDFNWNASGTLEYDGAAGTSEVDMGGLVAGQTHMVDAPALTANDYLYLTEGDDAATDGVYSAGQFLFTFYGMPVNSTGKIY
jgi:hypothetical protein